MLEEFGVREHGSKAASKIGSSTSFSAADPGGLDEGPSP